MEGLGGDTIYGLLSITYSTYLHTYILDKGEEENSCKLTIILFSGYLEATHPKGGQKYTKPTKQLFQLVQFSSVQLSEVKKERHAMYLLFK